MSEPVLECQDCGTPVAYLTPAETRLVAASPYNYVIYCGQCQTRRRPYPRRPQ